MFLNHVFFLFEEKKSQLFYVHIYYQDTFFQHDIFRALTFSYSEKFRALSFSNLVVRKIGHFQFPKEF